MGLIGAMILLLIGGVIGFAYFKYRQRRADAWISDPDYLDCEDATRGKADAGKQLAVCYIDKKSTKIKQHLNL